MGRIGSSILAVVMISAEAGPDGHFVAVFWRQDKKGSARTIGQGWRHWLINFVSRNGIRRGMRLRITDGLNFTNMWGNMAYQRDGDNSGKGGHLIKGKCANDISSSASFLGFRSGNCSCCNILSSSGIFSSGVCEWTKRVGGGISFLIFMHLLNKFCCLSEHSLTMKLTIYENQKYVLKGTLYFWVFFWIGKAEKELFSLSLLRYTYTTLILEESGWFLRNLDIFWRNLDDSWGIWMFLDDSCGIWMIFGNLDDFGRIWMIPPESWPDTPI